MTDFGNTDQAEYSRYDGHVWLNPPTDTWPPRPVLVRFTPEQARQIVAALIAAATTATPDRRELADLAHTVGLAVSIPADADAAGISRLDTAHPANQLSRLMPAALTELARWSGPRTLMANALDFAAAIAAHRDGVAGVRELITHARQKLDAIAHTGYGRVPPAAHTEQAGGQS